MEGKNMLATLPKLYGSLFENIFLTLLNHL